MDAPTVRAVGGETNRGCWSLQRSMRAPCDELLAVIDALDDR